MKFCAFLLPKSSYHFISQRFPPHNYSLADSSATAVRWDASHHRPKGVHNRSLGGNCGFSRPDKKGLLGQEHLL
jgi:hypothetical protein